MINSILRRDSRVTSRTKFAEEPENSPVQQPTIRSGRQYHIHPAGIFLRVTRHSENVQRQ